MKVSYLRYFLINKYHYALAVYLVIFISSAIGGITYPQVHFISGFMVICITLLIVLSRRAYNKYLKA
jgi:O-antigen ligase